MVSRLPDWLTTTFRRKSNTRSCTACQRRDCSPVRAQQDRSPASKVDILRHCRRRRFEHRPTDPVVSGEVRRRALVGTWQNKIPPLLFDPPDLRSSRYSAVSFQQPLLCKA